VTLGLGRGLEMNSDLRRLFGLQFFDIGFGVLGHFEHHFYDAGIVGEGGDSAALFDASTHLGNQFS
jgi:hypothetical protein